MRSAAPAAMAKAASKAPVTIDPAQKLCRGLPPLRQEKGARWGTEFQYLRAGSIEPSSAFRIALPNLIRLSGLAAEILRIAVSRITATPSWSLGGLASSRASWPWCAAPGRRCPSPRPGRPFQHLHIVPVVADGHVSLRSTPRRPASSLSAVPLETPAAADRESTNRAPNTPFARTRSSRSMRWLERNLRSRILARFR